MTRPSLSTGLALRPGRAVHREAEHVAGGGLRLGGGGAGQVGGGGQVLTALSASCRRRHPAGRCSRRRPLDNRPPRLSAAL